VVDAEAWFNDLVADGLTMLVALSLPGTPPAETIALTLNVWVNALWPRAKWSEEDAPRMHAAFVQLAGTCTRWPAPTQLVDALPPRPKPLQLAGPQLTPEQRAANKKRIADLIQRTREAMLARPSQPKDKA
jgi:hypothetical protein